MCFWKKKKKRKLFVKVVHMLISKEKCQKCECRDQEQKPWWLWLGLCTIWKNAPMYFILCILHLRCRLFITFFLFFKPIKIHYFVWVLYSEYFYGSVAITVESSICTRHCLTVLCIVTHLILPTTQFINWIMGMQKGKIICSCSTDNE